MTELSDYLTEIGLPDPVLLPSTPVAQAFLAKKVTRLWEAIQYVYQLPYRRTSDRANYLQVLAQGQGVCSTKHALLAALAAEQGVPLRLQVGIFMCNAHNTPAMASVLAAHGLPAFPEAHCYLRYQDHPLDITFPEAQRWDFPEPCEQVLEITPDQIGGFKIVQHQLFIRDWLKTQPGWTFDQIWAIREACIQQLFQSNEAFSGSGMPEQAPKNPSQLSA